MKHENVKISQLYKFAKPVKLPFAGAIGSLAVSTGVTMTIPKKIGELLDLSSNPDLINQISPLLQDVSGLIIIGAIANSSRIYLNQYCSETIQKNLRQQTFNSLIQKDVKFFDKNNITSAEIVSRLASDTNILGSSISEQSASFIRSFLQLTIGIYMAFMISPDLIFQAGWISLPVALAGNWLGKRMRFYSNKMQNELSSGSKIANETLGIGFKTVKVFNKEKYEMERYSNQVVKLRSTAMKEALAKAQFFGFNGLVGNAGLFYTLYCASILMQTGDLTAGGLTSFSLYITWMGIAISSLTKTWAEYSKMKGAGGRLLAFIDESDDKISQNFNNVNISPIKFENLTFSYPSRPDVAVLKNVNMTLGDENITAIVGGSGSGKSTLVQLILGLYDINEGKLVIGNDEMKNGNNFTQIKNQIGYVSQEPILFSTSIKENILYGLPIMPENYNVNEKLFQASKLANALQFIERLPNGFETTVGEQGTSLSGGQRQRIAIARALIREPKLLIFDEATSSLDSESEKSIQDAIKLTSENETKIIMIAHRLSTVKIADKIIVLNEGKIVEQGSFGELVENDGYFSKLVKTQQLMI